MFYDGITFLLKGGPVMYPLLACAIISVMVMIDRYAALRGVLRGSDEIERSVREALLQNREQSALHMLELRSGPIARVLLVALQHRALPREDAEALISEVAVEETPALARGLSSLDTIITIAPLLGLLGTVTGMIRAFKVVSISSGQTAPAAITGGVAEALIATATGLAIAIVTLVGYNYLTEQVKHVVSRMEIGATKILNVERIRRNGASVAKAAQENYAAPTIPK